MSAYLLDPEKLGQVVHIILDHVKFGDTKIDREFVIGVLAVQNIRSLKARYEDNRGLTADGVVKGWISSLETFGDYLKIANDVPYMQAPATIDLRLELVREYIYQSCETEDWDGTLSRLLTDKTTTSLLQGGQSDVVLNLS